MGGNLHGARLALHVHQDHRHAKLCGDRGGIFGPTKGRDIVPDRRARLHSGPRDIGLKRINADRTGGGLAKGLDHRQDPVHLGLSR